MLVRVKMNCNGIIARKLMSREALASVAWTMDMRIGFRQQERGKKEEENKECVEIEMLINMYIRQHYKRVIVEVFQYNFFLFKLN